MRRYLDELQRAYVPGALVAAEQDDAWMCAARWLNVAAELAQARLQK